MSSFNNIYIEEYIIQTSISLKDGTCCLMKATKKSNYKYEGNNLLEMKAPQVGKAV